MTIRTLLTDDHRACDDFFALAEQAAGGGDLPRAHEAFARFEQAMLAHFSCEEEVLFPAFEASTGMTGGPTQVMRMEHAQLRELLQAGLQALSEKQVEKFFDIGETLLILMQQHNLKEENVLYPMCDQYVPQVGGSVADRLAGAAP